MCAAYVYTSTEAHRFVFEHVMSYSRALHLSVESGPITEPVNQHFV